MYKRQGPVSEPGEAGGGFSGRGTERCLIARLSCLIRSSGRNSSVWSRWMYPTASSRSPSFTRSGIPQAISRSTGARISTTSSSRPSNAWVRRSTSRPPSSSSSAGMDRLASPDGNRTGAATRSRTSGCGLPHLISLTVPDTYSGCSVLKSSQPWCNVLRRASPTIIDFITATLATDSVYAGSRGKYVLINIDGI